MGGRGGSGRSVAAVTAAPSNDTGFNTGDQSLNELLDIFYSTPGYRVGGGVLTYEPSPGVRRDSDDPITLRDMREGLSRKYGWDRAKQDREFMRLHLARQINIYPFSKQLSLTQAMRDAAMNFGGERKDGFLLNQARQYRRSR